VEYTQLLYHAFYVGIVSCSWFCSWSPSSDWYWWG